MNTPFCLESALAQPSGVICTSVSWLTPEWLRQYFIIFNDASTNKHSWFEHIFHVRVHDQGRAMCMQQMHMHVAIKSGVVVCCRTLCWERPGLTRCGYRHCLTALLWISATFNLACRFITWQVGSEACIRRGMHFQRECDRSWSRNYLRPLRVNT